MSHAFIFPGQGSQTVGMGRALAAAFPEAQRVFQEADDALGRPLTKLIEEGPASELTLTWNTQPAILTVSIACLAALRARTGGKVAPVAFAGHSLGEYSALVASGALSFSDAVRTVEKRGRFMQEAVPVGVGSMVAVLGLDIEPLLAICRELSTPGHLVSVANDNSPGQAVLSGHAGAVAAAAERAKAAGAKRCVELPVSAPFHCALMEPAAQRLAEVLAEVKFSNPAAPVVANVDARANADAARMPDLLRRQVASPVLWQDCVRTLKGLGAATLVEIGPGKVLSGLVKRIEPELNVMNVEDPASLEAFAGGLA